MRIFLVEDEPSIAMPLSYYLESEGLEVTVIGDGSSALEQFALAPPDLVLLDLMLPGTHGIEVCRRIRETSQVPIIVLSAKSSEVDKVLALELGADDYVTKPYSARELLARIKSIMRRADAGPAPDLPPDGDVLELPGQDISLNTARRTLTVRGEEQGLPRKEFELLEMLLRNRGRVLTREQLMTRIWGSDYYGDTKTLDVHIKRLRARIEDSGAAQRVIHTVRSVGYRLG